MNKITRLLLMFGMVSIITAQPNINFKNAIVTEATIGDTVMFSNPRLISFIKSSDGRWFMGVFIKEQSFFIEEMFYKPYNDAFTVIVGQQAIPFGANVPFFDLTRFDPFTYQTGLTHNIFEVGRGISFIVGDNYELYYGSTIEDGVHVNGYSTFRYSFDWKNQYIGLSWNNRNRQATDISVSSKYIDYVFENSYNTRTRRTDSWWLRAIVKPHPRISVLLGYEDVVDSGSKPLYGLMWSFGENRTNPQAGNFLSAEFSGEGDVIVKLNCVFGMTLPGFSWDGLGFDSKENDDE
jgi:hypothetical protein